MSISPLRIPLRGSQENFGFNTSSFITKSLPDLEAVVLDNDGYGFQEWYLHAFGTDHHLSWQIESLDNHIPVNCQECLILAHAEMEKSP